LNEEAHQLLLAADERTKAALHPERKPRMKKIIEGKRYNTETAERLAVWENHKGVKNEMDAVFTAKNRLHIIECKSGRMTGGRVNRADTVVYKLDNLRDLIGGDYGKAMLVTYWPISEADRKRLGDNGMQIAEGVKLLDMEHRLRSWASKA
ncbi:MAG: DUF1887 family CARF protein, partial [Desulfococcus multivorans]|nr:DUF1887 family CARF protein [Desulfococcus multivorans]